MPEWEGRDPQWWNEGGGENLEEEAREALRLMEKFLEIKDPHKERLEAMIQKVNESQFKFSALKTSRSKDILNTMFLRINLHISVEYLKIFLQMEIVDEETCMYMNALIKILESNYEGLSRFFPPEVVALLQDQIDSAVMKIAGTYPEILDN